MADSVRKRIRNDLADALARFVPDAHVSLLANEPAERTHRYPAIILHAVDDVPLADGAVGFATRRATWAAECWTRATDAGAQVVDDVEDLLSTVVKAVCADPSRGGLALDTTVGEAVFLLIVQAQRLAGVEVQLRVEYRHPYGQPDAA